MFRDRYGYGIKLYITANRNALIIRGVSILSGTSVDEF
jgi:hypothetical protein